jgi:hypothetical protein
MPTRSPSPLVELIRAADCRQGADGDTIATRKYKATSMKRKLMSIPLVLVLAAASPLSAAESESAHTRAKVCSTLGKVHAQRDRQLFAVGFQSIDGQLTTHRNDRCIMLPAGKHVIGLVAGTEVAAFPQRRQPRGALEEQLLELDIEPGRTYTVAAQVDNRYKASWIPVVQRVEVWQ